MAVGWIDYPPSNRFWTRWRKNLVDYFPEKAFVNIRMEEISWLVSEELFMNIQIEQMGWLFSTTSFREIRMQEVVKFCFEKPFISVWMRYIVGLFWQNCWGTYKWEMLVDYSQANRPWRYRWMKTGRLFSQDPFMNVRMRCMSWLFSKTRWWMKG